VLTFFKKKASTHFSIHFFTKPLILWQWKSEHRTPYARQSEEIHQRPVIDIAKKLKRKKVGQINKHMGACVGPQTWIADLFKNVLIIPVIVMIFEKVKLTIRIEYFILCPQHKTLGRPQNTEGNPYAYKHTFFVSVSPLRHGVEGIKT
jgi:hypothetical protein